MQTGPDLMTRWPALDVTAKSARLAGTCHVEPGDLRDAISTSAGSAARAGEQLWRRDASAWSNDPAVQSKIANRLGWLSSPALMADSLPRLQAFASSVRSQQFTDVVLLGMGGSSLAPEVLRAVLGVAPSWPRFQMLDSTDPAAVRAAATTPERTLYILASKSGSTIEPNVLAAHFRRTLEEARVPKWADHFIAITDPGTELERRARAEGFRDVFLNPGDIGGRYSAVSFFGLVPAALMGLDVSGLVGWALAMLAACERHTGDVQHNPAVALGLAIGAAARAGHDKLTLLLPASLEPLGLWIEQLVAESTGKNGTGIVPIAGEKPAGPAAYGPDRVFVRLRLGGAGTAEAHGALGGNDDIESSVHALTTAGAPVVDITLPEPSALGAEFVRWEVATAIAGALLQVNPFDEPNVQQAKDSTRVLLNQYQSAGRLPIPPTDRTIDNDITLTMSAAARRELNDASPEALLTLLRRGQYFALLAYVGPDRALADELRALRIAVRDRTRAATMWGYGPRYLHSTGQLHKGGPNTGVFLLVSAAPREDLSIPDERFSFGTLELAQALGDFASLDATGRRAVHAHLAAPDPRLIARLAGLMLDRLPR
jgi:glucose-6-phosphate isomerase